MIKKHYAWLDDVLSPKTDFFWLTNLGNYCVLYFITGYIGKHWKTIKEFPDNKSKAECIDECLEIIANSEWAKSDELYIEREGDWYDENYEENYEMYGVVTDSFEDDEYLNSLKTLSPVYGKEF